MYLCMFMCIYNVYKMGILICKQNIKGLHVFEFDVQYREYFMHRIMDYQ